MRRTPVKTAWMADIMVASPSRINCAASSRRRLGASITIAAVILLSSFPAMAQGTSSGVGQGVMQPDVTTRELLAIMNERDHRYTQRANGQETAIAKAEAAAEKRFDSVNEFRAQLKDQQNTFMPRAEASIRFDGIEKRLADIDVRMNRDSGRTEGANWLWGGMLGFAGALGGLLIGGVAVAGLIMKSKTKTT